MRTLFYSHNVSELLFLFVLLLRAQKKNQEKGKKNDASTHRPTPSPPFFWANAQRSFRLFSLQVQVA